MGVEQESWPLKLPQSPKWRFGKGVSIGQINLLGIVGMSWWWSWNEYDMWEKPSGEWLPEQYPPKKLPNIPSISSTPPKEEDGWPVGSSIKFIREELFEKLRIPTADEFWVALDKEWSLYQYLIETRKDWDDLFEYIKHDLISWTYGSGEKNTNLVENFIKWAAIVSSRIKKDLKDYPIMWSIIDFIWSPDFYKTYINTGKPVIDCFLDTKIKPVCDQKIINQLWFNFKWILKRNNSIEDYNLYISGINLVLYRIQNSKNLVGRYFIYPGKEELVKSYMDIFDNEVIWAFVEYAKEFLGLWAGFHKLIHIEYGHKSGQWRSEYDLIVAARSKNRPKKVQTSNQLTIHNGNRDADSLLSKRLRDQLSPITDDTIKHCIISGCKWCGKTTIIKHYLSEIQSKFPRARIWEFSMEGLAKEISMIAQEPNPELKSKGFDTFTKKLNDCDVMYISDFDKIMKGKYWIKWELIKMINSGHTRLILESENSLNHIADELEKDSHTTVSDPEKRKRNKYHTMNLRKRLFADVYEAQNEPPTPLARRNIIQNISKELLKTPLPDNTANYLAWSLFQVEQCRKIINTIKSRLTDILTVDEVAKKIINQNLTWGVNLQLSKVRDWFEEFADGYDASDNPISLGVRSEMFAAYTYMMTEEKNMWNPVPQYWKIEDIARHSLLRSKKPTHGKLREYFTEHRFYHEERCRFVSAKIAKLMDYGVYGLGLWGDLNENLINKIPSEQ